MNTEYELSAMQVELQVLEAEHEAEELWVSDEYQELKRRVTKLEQQLENDGDTTDASRHDTVETASQR